MDGIDPKVAATCRWAVRVILIAGFAFLVLSYLPGCATYDACKDPKSYIDFMPEQCHAKFNRY